MNWLKKAFYSLGAFLVDCFKLGQSEKGRSELHQELISLSSGKRTAVRNYYVRKTAVFLATLTAGTILTVMGLLVYLTDRTETQVESLTRTGYGE